MDPSGGARSSWAHDTGPAPTPPCPVRHRAVPVTTRRRRVPVGEGRAPGKLRREPVWAGVAKGELVDVADTGLRSATWEFVAHVRNLETGDEWIEVVGGKDG